MVEITMEVEEHFDINVPDEVSDRIRSVADVVDGVVRFVDKTEF